MADITMCGKPCDQHKDKCYRALATPSYYQSYSDELKPGENGNCAYFMPAFESEVNND